VKIRNCSNLTVDEELWLSIVVHLGLSGELKDKDIFEQDELLVDIHKEKERSGEDRYYYGEYTCGKIDIFPCKNCTSGTVFITFLHELMHHWLWEFHEDYYFKNWVEEFCDSVADDIFISVGGILSEVNNCERFTCPSDIGKLSSESEAGQILNRLFSLRSEKLEEFVGKSGWRS